MALVTWTQQALDDLEAVCLFIARDAPQYAQLFATRVFRATDRLEDFPQMGRVVPEIDRDDIRELIVQSYRIIYRLLPDEVEILPVHHFKDDGGATWTSLSLSSPGFWAECA